VNKPFADFSDDFIGIHPWKFSQADFLLSSRLAFLPLLFSGNLLLRLSLLTSHYDSKGGKKMPNFFPKSEWMPGFDATLDTDTALLLPAGTLHGSAAGKASKIWRTFMM